MKTVLKIFGFAILLLIAAVVLVPQFFSMDDVTTVLRDEVRTATGRELVIEGEQSFSIIPSLTLQLNRVSLSNMASGSRDDMITMERLDVHIPWASLFSGELSVEKFVIEQPDILLETDAAGNTNWDLLQAGEAVPEESAGETPALPAGFDISLGEVAIYGGRISMIDQLAGTEQYIEDLELIIELPSLRQDLQLKGGVAYMGETLQLVLTVSTPAQAISGEPFDVALQLGSRLLTLDYRGRISEGGAEVAGLLEVKGDSVKELLAWQGQALEAGESAFNAFELSSDIVFAGEALQLEALSAKLDALEISGNSRIELTEIPSIKADINLGMLDVNPYLPPVEDNANETAAADAEAPAEPIVWDDTPIDLSALKSVNADITLRSSGLRARDIKLEENALHISLDQGKAKVALQKFSAYEGQGKGSVAVDASRSPYRISTDFDLSGIDAQPLLTDVVGFDKLMGKGQLNWQLKTGGVSQKDFVSALQGKLGFSFLDGAIRGANIAAMVRSAEGLVTGDMSKVGLDKTFDKASQTDFSEMGGTLVFTKGVGRNEDLTLSSPLLRITGMGTVDLPRTEIDYDVKARLVSTIEGQSAGGKAKGVGIPIDIKGPFHDVKIKPNLRKATEDKVKDTVIDKLFKRFK